MHYYSLVCDIFLCRARADSDFSASLGDDTALPGQPTPVAGAPPTHKLMVGDWIAQWDASYNAWFFYNIKTGETKGSKNT